MAGNMALRVVPAALVALGLVAGGWAMGNGLVRAKAAGREVTVRGLAERDVVADLATWTLDYSATGGDLTTVQAQIDHDTQAIQALLTANGFTADEASVAGTTVNQFRNNQGVLTITIRQKLQLRTTKVMQARRTFAQQTALVRQGVALQDSSGIVYSFTKLNALKPAMIGEATRDARAGAQQFAHDSGAGVGAIRHATQGYFTVGARDGEGEGSGQASPFQKVRVVTTVDFLLD
ncbi:SIMPL domain-containing protein [Sphingomonas bacterium]|uniref:SIMPL domain-containing protein n=1 Tax=Sphingomonas bacterium TaxID=1895847 RepID=UPI001576973E|nr:SIMPL domain-containing protein [Sphingomonas bacterium]